MSKFASWTATKLPNSLRTCSSRITFVRRRPPWVVCSLRSPPPRPCCPGRILSSGFAGVRQLPVTARLQSCAPAHGLWSACALGHDRRRWIAHGTQLDEIDRAIIEQLQVDGRVPYTQLGAAVGLSEAAVRQRVQRLIDAGVMQVVGVTNPLSVGRRRMAMIGVRIAGPTDPVAEALRGDRGHRLPRRHRRLVRLPVRGRRRRRRRAARPRQPHPRRPRRHSPPRRSSTSTWSSRPSPGARTRASAGPGANSGALPRLG